MFVSSVFGNDWNFIFQLRVVVIWCSEYFCLLLQLSPQLTFLLLNFKNYSIICYKHICNYRSKHLNLYKYLLLYYPNANCLSPYYQLIRHMLLCHNISTYRSCLSKQALYWSLFRQKVLLPPFKSYRRFSFYCVQRRTPRFVSMILSCGFNCYCWVGFQFDLVLLYTHQSWDYWCFFHDRPCFHDLSQQIPNIRIIGNAFIHTWYS